MNWKRIGRAAICLLVVCCLLFNISPIKAHAVAAEIAGTLILLSGMAVIGSIMIGLGLQVGNSVDWDNVVSRCYSDLVTSGVIDAAGQVQAWALEGAEYAYGVSQDLIQQVRDWAYANEVIQEMQIAVEEGYWYYNGIHAKPYPQDVDLTQYPYIMIGYSSYYNTPRCIFSSQPLLVSNTFTNYSIFWNFIAEEAVDVLIYEATSDTIVGWKLLSSREDVTVGSQACALNAYIGGFEQVTNDMWANYDIFGTQAFNYGECLVPGLPAITEACTVVSVAAGVTAGQIATSDQDLQVGYELWLDNSVLLEGTSSGSGGDDSSEPEKQRVWPLFMPELYSDLHDMTQTEIWEGNQTSDDPSSDPDLDPDPLEDPLANTPADRFIDRLVDAVTKPFEWLADTILSGIRAIFVPSTDFLTEKVNALTARFAFADSIVRTGQALYDGLSGVTTEPPVIYIDLGASEGSYDIGGEVVFLDLRWYAAYKPTVDKIISAFLWACFIWRMLLKLPGIINGAAGTVSILSSSGSKEDL